MIDSFKVVLCDEKTPSVDVFVNAEVCDGRLRVSGQDLGAAAQDFWDNDEYEYFYSFSEENTDRLFSLLQTDTASPAQALTERFSGMDGCKNLRSFCEENSIQFDFFSH